MLKMVVNTDQKKGKINKNIYGHFSEHLGRCIYEGYWVGSDSHIPNERGIRKDVIKALREIKIPVLRWPGGCFADEYHWMDGIGPYETRASMINTHWGGVVENNHFGTYEFMDLCQMLGAEPYICGNVGSGTVREMSDWVEYLTFDGQSPMSRLRRKNGREEPWKLRYFGIGNENWGCGGNMRPEYYADVYRRYAQYVRKFSGNEIYKIACGPSGPDYHWAEVMMREAGKHMNGLALHWYTSIPWSATEFGESIWFTTMKTALRMEEMITRHGAIMDQYDPEKKVDLIVDEWGLWSHVEPGTNPGFLYQQNTLRDALVAGITLNIFNNHCDRVQMANIAQTVNVLQAMILTRGEEMILTPTYHVFDMYKVHQDAWLLDAAYENLSYCLNDENIPALSMSASIDAREKIHITLSNCHPEQTLSINCDLRGNVPESVTGTILTADAMNVHNTFEAPDAIQPVAFNGVSLTDGKATISLPPMSIVALELE